MLGPEHEFSIVDEELRALPIADKVLKDLHGRIVNCVQMPKFSFGKELQLHVLEVRPNTPFSSPIEFENTMQEAVITLQEFLHRRYNATLLGTGMHPLLRLGDTNVWPHRHRQIYEAYSQIFNLKRHGWLNIQSYQLNLSYSDEESGVLLHNLIANVLPYLPAITASSPIYEGKLGEDIDNRLKFYKENQHEIPSITAEIVPEYVHSFQDYRTNIIEKYSNDLMKAGASGLLLGMEWINSRGAIFRFDRRALEIRVIDEQECVKTDVALSCFIRAVLRGFLKERPELQDHSMLVKDLNSVVKNGLGAHVQNPRGKTALDINNYLLRIASQNATEEEKKYLPVIGRRIENGNLSEILRDRIIEKSNKTDLRDAIISVYQKLTESLIDNQPYF